MGRDKTKLQKGLDTYLNDIENNSIALKLNLFLAVCIFISVFSVMIGTLPDLSAQARSILLMLEYTFCLIFLLEYFARVYSSDNKISYMFSVYGLLDICAIIPILFVGIHESVFLRVVRAISILRLLKLFRYATDIKIMISTLGQSAKLFITLGAMIIMLSLIGGNIIYFIEPGHFTSAFDGAWWSLVTMSTVGYGDYVPHTSAGRIVASGAMIIGIGLFAIVTGLISSKINRVAEEIEHSNHIDRIDLVSGTYSKEFILEELKHEINVAGRFQTPLSVVIVTINNLSKISEYGKNSSNKTLRVIGSILKEQIRKSDLVGRGGDDSFIVIESHTEELGANVFKRRIAQELNNLNLEHLGVHQAIDTSIRIIEWDKHIETVDELLDYTIELPMYNI